MTEIQAHTINEINRFYQRLGRWPNVSALAYIMKVSQPNMTIRIKRMVERGYLEYVGEWKNGQTRQVKTV